MRRDRPLHVMRILKFGSIALLVLGVACQATSKAELSSANRPANLNISAWESSRDAATKAEATSDKQEKARLAKEGIELAEQCIMTQPEDAACYYYRAINTSIYYEAHVVGYQNGLMSMIKDCEKTISLDERFDHGGAYRILGKIYTEVPETTFVKNGVSRDLEKAVAYLEKAVQLDSGYHENYIYLADAQYELGRKKEALTSLSNSISLVPQWENHNDYALWQRLNKELSNKLK